uniref:Neur_chan_LBD domain-containing protein n=1 Tax=Meloidogyne hapla TaxID=6305 RepID=A0A1I8BDZ4_MELHA
MIFVIILFIKCIVIANLKPNSVQSVDHEEEHTENNEPDEAGSNDIKCQNWKGRNTTDDEDLLDEQFTELENCVWNSLLAKEHAHSPRQIHPMLSPPPEYPLRFSVENLVVEQVDTSWNDSRLKWEKTEWALEGISLEEERRRGLWTPDFMDDSYPEERNDCCLFLGLADVGRTVEDRHMTAVVISNLMETSPWAVQSQAIEPARVDGSRSDSLRLCVQSKKEMSTLRIALRIPVTIATLMTLVSPLFGDLRTQAFVKLLTLVLQTICFLFLCSIAPASGFGGSKPKLCGKQLRN